MEWIVMWTIEVDADYPDEAAHRALEIMRDPESTATCFQVVGKGEGGEMKWSGMHEVDLQPR